MTYAVCIDLGGTNFKLALVDRDYSVRAKKVIGTDMGGSRKQFLDALTGGVEAIMREAGLTRKSVKGVGIGVPGPVNAATGFVHLLPNIPGIRNINLKQLLSRRLGIAVYVDNDAKLMCVAESAAGAAHGFSNVLCVTLGTGVGGALILNGRLYRGNDNAAGEFGHTPLNEHGPVCPCGGRACLERYIGNASIFKEARSHYPAIESLEELTARARKGDAQAVALWDSVGTRLGIALAGAVNLLNLDAVVVGGGVAGAGRYLFDAVRRTIRERAMSVQGRRVCVVRARLGNNAGLIGAAVMVMKGTA